ncbi:myosin heavy chain, striated muscle-like isoform X3 [Ostrea edulis]|uniref:myosin heavy chain, striated muscle-like isoform X3 n=1 Tax=Ostrea edulis TaxID=37623 RepID=UPI0024AFCB85|nr:myosin heavy chain, striated muscle-like isoform X3 [Ostrea edulis]
MSMNYVGSVSILDRGDEPAQAIIDKNKRSLAQRIADETKDELDKVMHRVEDIYISYEQSTQDMFLTHGANVEYIEDIKELEEILTDELKKKKYEQKVTVFIVGFENMSNQRLRLIQQVNEFFMDATRPPEEEPLYAPSPDINIEEIGQSIEDTLDSADRLTDRLGELNAQMVEWLTNFAINKASSKKSKIAEEGKKKMEKALDKAKDDLSGLSEKLLKLQSEMEVKEEKVQQLLKQLEIKTNDTQKFRTAAEAAKKSIQDLEDANTRHAEAIKKKDEQIRELNSKLSMLQLEVGQSDYLTKKSSERNQEKSHELQPEEMQKKLADLQELVDNNKASFLEAQRDWQKLHDQQVVALSTVHKEEMAEMKAAFEEEIKKSKEQVSEVEQQVFEAEKAAAVAADQADKLRQNLIELQLRGNSAESKVFTEPDSQGDDASQQAKTRESRPSTKSSKQSVSVTQKQKSAAKPPPTITKSPVKVKETAESSIQDEGGDHSSAHVETRQSKRNKSTLDPVPETDIKAQFEDKFELADEKSWSSVPKDQVPGRFAQYRQLSHQRISELEEQLALTLAKTQRKVNTLKSQFQDHKSKWEAERNVLIEQVEQAQKLQNEAEKEADDAMTQLEEFINEQEKLEEEEEGKRTDITRRISQPIPKVVTPPPKQVSPPPQVVTEGTDQELSNLMQQTDDAKAEARITSGAMSAPPAVEPEETPPRMEEIRKSLPKKYKKVKVDSGTQTDPELSTEFTEDDMRLNSSHSRASLRNQFRNRLEESRHAAEERRSKSPAISVPSQRSIDDQLVEDDDFPIPDEIKEEIEMEDRGTSPPPDAHRQSTAMSRKLSEHPVVGEYLKAYEGVVSFKDNLSRIMQDREFLQASELLQELDFVKFDMESKVQPQLENMTKNIYYTLEEIMSVLSSMLYVEREPLVSSLNGMLVSRDQTRNTLQNRERSADSGRGQTATRGSNQSFSTHFPQSASSQKEAYKELQQNYEKLQLQLNEESKKHEEQMRHNTVVMMEMQDTINDLQRELNALGRASGRDRPPSEGVQQPPPESAIMFTRLDSERNAKIMKRAVNDERLDTNKYKDAVTTMDEYVSLPAKRLGHLVRKYVHHSRMKDIEENVKKSKSLDENVFEILDKMEALQNQRAKRWADKMDDMGSERMRLANLLMETLDSIEQESGIFLIKPMYSYRGSPLDVDYTRLLEEIKERYAGKLSRPTRPHRVISPSREISAFAPAPTPASNVRGISRHMQQFSDTPQQPLFRREIPRPLEGDETGLMGSAALGFNTTAQRQTWNMSTSLVRGDSTDGVNSLNTPRILELDINRMLIGQNTVSSKYGSPGLTDDRLINASQNNLRSYVTVNRPMVNSTRPRSFTGTKDVPTTTPVSRSVTSNSAGNKRVRLSESEMSTRHSIPSTPPLPPILGQDITEIKEPPRSPPGSSLRGSPTPQPHVTEVISPLK